MGFFLFPIIVDIVMQDLKEKVLNIIEFELSFVMATLTILF